MIGGIQYGDSVWICLCFSEIRRNWASSVPDLLQWIEHLNEYSFGELDQLLDLVLDLL